MSVHSTCVCICMPSTLLCCNTPQPSSLHTCMQGPPLHALIIVGDTHELEQTMLDYFRVPPTPAGGAGGRSVGADEKSEYEGESEDESEDGAESEDEAESEGKDKSGLKVRARMRLRVGMRLRVRMRMRMRVRMTLRIRVTVKTATRVRVRVRVSVLSLGLGDQVTRFVCS